MPGVRQFRIARFVALVCIAGPLAFAADCASGSAQSAPGAPSQSASWTLAYHLSGGFAGFDRQLELSSSGAATATDRRRQLTRTAQVPDDELRAIASMVAAAQSADLRSSGCNDCFEYKLDVQNGDARVTIRANDAGMSGGNAAALVRALRQLVNRILSETQP